MKFEYKARRIADLRNRFKGPKPKKPASAFHRGRKFEWIVRKHFQCLGFFVLRSAASRTPVDLIAVKLGMLLFIQCKLKQELSKEQRVELGALAEHCGAIAISASIWGMKRINVSGEMSTDLPF